MGRRVVVAAVGMALGLAVGVSGPAHAQQMLLAPSESYNLGGFNYKAPTSPFWRQLSASGTTLEMVYVEQLEDGNINSRTHVVVEASPVPEGTQLTGASMLAALSLAQQLESREGTVKDSTTVTAVPGDLGIQTYTIRSEAADVQLAEVFYVLLSKDKSEYAVAKLASREPGFENTPYFLEFYASLAGFSHKSDAAAVEPAAP